MPALAITDFTNLCGLVKFWAGHGAGIKPIVGADFNVHNELLGDELTPSDGTGGGIIPRDTRTPDVADLESVSARLRRQARLSSATG